MRRAGYGEAAPTNTVEQLPSPRARFSFRRWALPAQKQTEGQRVATVLLSFKVEIVERQVLQQPVVLAEVKRERVWHGNEDVVASGALW